MGMLREDAPFGGGVELVVAVDVVVVGVDVVVVGGGVGGVQVGRRWG